MKSTCTQGCSSLPSEVRISPRQEGRVRGQEIGRKAWRHELSCQGLDCVHSLLDVSVALILSRFSFFVLVLVNNFGTIFYFLNFFLSIATRKNFHAIRKEATHAHTHTCLHTYTCFYCSKSTALPSLSPCPSPVKTTLKPCRTCGK